MKRLKMCNYWEIQKKGNKSKEWSDKKYAVICPNHHMISSKFRSIASLNLELVLKFKRFVLKKPST